MQINWAEMEKKWQKKRESERIYATTETPEKEKFYILDMFPYPSGAGLHVGHPKGYIATDTLTRKKMLEGFSVLHPMGFDTFGLGTEQYAIDNKMQPQVVAQQNIGNFKRQLANMGFSYDRERSFSTADPDYYQWTQWIFLQLYQHYYDEEMKKALPISELEKKLTAEGVSGKELREQLDNARLAYLDYKPINRCPHCKTGLANEDLEDGKCERCGSEVEQRPMRQWVLRITKYADRLLEGLDSLDWDESMKELERNRIGKSSGTQFKMDIVDNPSGSSSHLPGQGGKNNEIPIFNPPARGETSEARGGLSTQKSFEVFTTRIDTVFGMSFVVMSPEHQLVDTITTEEYREAVNKYKEQAKYKTQLERTELQKEKTGQFTGAYAINPFNGEEVPIFIGDYVLANYGTGVVMAVPAHDERDFAFAKKYDIPIVQSIAPIYPAAKPEAIARPDKPMITRNVVYAIVYNPKTDKYLILNNLTGETGQSFVVGGIEEGENAISCGIREIQEETGYQNIQHIKKIGGEVHAKFYAIHKDENRYAKAVAHLYELVDEKREEVNAREKSRHEVLWLSKDEIQISFKNQHFFWEIYLQGEGAYCEKGVLVNSGEFTDLTSDEAIAKMQERLTERGLGGKKNNYKIQDWVFSRQRYRGEPFPIVFCPQDGVVPLDESALPLTLPEVEQYEPTGREEGPLDDVKWRMETTCPLCGKPAKRESNTMPGRAGSSWYRLRYMDPKNANALVGKDKQHYRKNVDVYVGGAEHVTRHMIYARFWQKFLYDIGVVSEQEPFQKYEKVGLIMAEDGRKMSKRWGNVVNPDEVIAEYGADAFRMYEMFMGPFDQSISWNTNGLKGVKKFLDKVIALWDKVEKSCGDNDLSCSNVSRRDGSINRPNNTDNNRSRDKACPCPNGEAVITPTNGKAVITPTNGEAVITPKEVETLLHQTIKKTTEDIDAFRFNTTISQFMIFVNKLSELDNISPQLFETFIILLAPFAPHLAEEFWQKLGKEFSIFTTAKRPNYDEKKLTSDMVPLAIQFNGKVRGTVEVSPTASQEEVLEKLKGVEKLAEYLTSGTVKKVIYVPGKIMNVVMG